MSNEKIEYPDKFMEELRLQLQRHHDAYNSIMTKANSLLVVSGITASIMLGFYSNILNLFNNELYHYWFLATLGLIVASIIMPLITFDPKNTTYPLVSSKYFDSKGCINKDKIKKRCEMNEGDITITASSYFESMRDIEKQNLKKSRFLKFGIELYISSITSLLILLHIMKSSI